MIISHKHQFIFLKPRKVAGTSIEVALAPLCGPDDSITPVTDFRPGVDEAAYEQISRNDDGLFNHMLPAQIKQVLRRRGQVEVWNKYRKVTVVRNPWDMLVSQFYWQQSYTQPVTIGRWARLWRKVRRNVASPAHVRHVVRKHWRRRVLGKPNPRQDFGEFIRNLHPKFLNSPFYFAGGRGALAAGAQIPDLVIRYEHLQQDFDAVCTKLGLPQTDLPRLKTGARKTRAHYSTMYTPETREIVAQLCAAEIAAFGYTFEEVSATQ